jgi:hypothetical protein
MEIIKAFPAKKPGRPVTYPWPEWSDGQVRRLFRGEDFFAHPKSFRVTIHRTAKNLGLKAHTHIESDDAIIVYFYDPADSE